jgi:acyl-CoA dehydrogenase
MPGLSFDFTDEQRMLREMVHDFVERECPKDVALKLDEAEEFPWELWKAMAAAGLHGIAVDEAYGGQGGDIVDQMIICEELSRSLAGLTFAWGNTSFSGAKSVGLYGSETQKREMLPALARGELMFAIAFTEPGGGSDALNNIRTRAKKVDGGWVINGLKTWSTGAASADRLLVVTRTSDGERPSQGLTMFVVDANAPGITKAKIRKLGMRSLASCEIGFDDVFVGDEDVIGEIDNGWRQLTATLNNERMMVAAACTGILRGVLEEALKYAGERHAFGKPLGQLQVLQHGIADIKVGLETARLHTYRAAWLQQRGRPSGVESTTATLVASELATKAADFGIQLLGGYGYAMEYQMQRYWRDVRLFRIAPISNEMARNYLGQSLGLPRSY